MSDHVEIHLPTVASKHVEAILADYNYTKQESSPNSSLYITDYSWYDDAFPPYKPLLDKLDQIGHYAFIRIGTEPGDIEVHGNPEGFNISLDIEVSNG